jgi:hypothetical protein
MSNTVIKVKWNITENGAPYFIFFLGMYTLKNKGLVVQSEVGCTKIEYVFIVSVNTIL